MMWWRAVLERWVDGCELALFDSAIAISLRSVRRGCLGAMCALWIMFWLGMFCRLAY